jgi:serine/threonine protein kinase
MAIFMELLSNGELFEYVVDAGGFREDITKNIFKTMIETLAHCQKKGIAHRDLKPENLLIDSKFNIKFADFGFATSASEEDSLSSYKGTEPYMAPEIIQGNQYSGFKGDIFALGAILFIIYAGFPAYQAKADPKADPWYKLFVNNNAMFWKYHQKRKPQGFFSDNFKDLFNRMCAYDADDRIAAEDVLKHPWLEGAATDEEKNGYFNEIKKAVDDRLAAEREEALRAKKEAEERAKNANLAFKGIRPFNRSVESINEDAKLLEQMVNFESDRKLKTHVDQGFKALTQLQSAMPLDYMFKVVCVAANKALPNITVAGDKYKIESHVNKDEGSCTMDIQITKVDDLTHCVEFNKKNGNTMLFYSLVDKIKKSITQEEAEADADAKKSE